MIKASDYISSFLVDNGVKVVFGYIGGMITHLVDSISKNSNLHFVQTYHEQSAAMAAEGYAIESGHLGVAIATSGPGATNLLTGIADAYFDSIPVLYITGQVNSYEYKYDKPIRQQGFQETDVVSIVKPVTKYAVFVDDVKKLRYELEKAIYIAMHGRKGPVLLDIAMNVQRENVEPECVEKFRIPQLNQSIQFNAEEICNLISSCHRPMVLVGSGCKYDKIQLSEFIVTNQFPVVVSLMGKGLIDEGYQYFMGMVGSYGNRCANISISQSDLLIVLGSRLDVRQTGAMLKGFMSKGKIIHVDIDNNELTYHRLQNRIKLHLSVNEFLSEMNKEPRIKINLDKWHSYLNRIKADYNQDREIERFVQNKSPYHLMQKLNTLFKEGDVVTTDVGQNQMWAAQTLKMKKDMRFVTSGGLAPMGYALPSAVGIAFANSKRKVYCLCGDGGFHISLQSLMLISQYRLNIRVIVLNNSSLGMITQFQHLYFNDSMMGTTVEGGYLVPDISKIASAYNMKYGLLTDKDSLSTVSSVINSCNLIEYKIEGLTTVCPKLEYNKAIQYPIPSLGTEEEKSILFHD